MTEPTFADEAADRYEVSTDPGRLDVAFICRSLAASYWAKSRPREKIEASIRSSLCFGLYDRLDGRQLGFARIVTDRVTFAWLCDVVIDEAERGRGLGKRLLTEVFSHPDVKAVPCLLGTRDAHGLYEKFGFVRSEGMRRPADGAPPPDSGPSLSARA